MTDDAAIRWELTTFEGVRRLQRAEFMMLPLRDKIRILEEMQQVAEAFRRVTASGRGPFRPAAG
jgi:hypothetical protein